jgi:hypothetical protein
MPLKSARMRRSESKPQAAERARIRVWAECEEMFRLRASIDMGLFCCMGDVSTDDVSTARRRQIVVIT